MKGFHLSIEVITIIILASAVMVFLTALFISSFHQQIELAQIDLQKECSGCAGCGLLYNLDCTVKEDYSGSCLSAELCCGNNECDGVLGENEATCPVDCSSNECGSTCAVEEGSGIISLEGTCIPTESFLDTYCCSDSDCTSGICNNGVCGLVAAPIPPASNLYTLSYCTPDYSGDRSPVTVYFRWKPIPGAHHYRVYVYKGPTAFNWYVGRIVYPSECSSTRCQDIWYNFPSGTTHYWFVAAYPYRSEYTSSNSAVKTMATVSCSTQPQQICSAVKYRGSSTNKLDIVFVGDDYTSSEFSKFESEVSRQSNFLLGFSPWNEQTNKVNIWRVNKFQDLGCYLNCGGIQRKLCCDYTKVRNLAKECPYDEIYVILDTTKYGGTAFLGGDIAMGTANTYGPRVAVHELGHSFAALRDEYSYGVSTGLIPNNLVFNCDVAGCPKWSGTPGTGCYRECTYDNWYRSVYNGIMRNILSNDFGIINKNFIRFFLGYYR